MFPEFNFNLMSWEFLEKSGFTDVLFRVKKARMLHYSISHSLAIGCLEGMRCMTSQHPRHMWATQLLLVRGNALDKVGTSISC